MSGCSSRTPAEGSETPSTLRRVSESIEPSTVPEHLEHLDQLEHGSTVGGVDGAEVDALPVLAQAPGILRAQRLARGLARDRGTAATALPAVQAVAVAA